MHLAASYILSPDEHEIHSLSLRRRLAKSDTAVLATLTDDADANSGLEQLLILKQSRLQSSRRFSCPHPETVEECCQLSYLSDSMHWRVKSRSRHSICDCLLGTTMRISPSMAITASSRTEFTLSDPDRYRVTRARWLRILP